MAWKNYSKEEFEKIKDRRYSIVEKLLKLNSKDPVVYDEKALKFIITELIESGTVYVSEKAYSIIRNYAKCSPNEKICQLCSISIAGLSNRALTYNDYKILKKGLPKNSLCWEHVVPINVLIASLITQYSKNEYTEDYFSNIAKIANVCIVTSQENKKLTEWQSKMPEQIDPQKEPWARYEKCNIQIHKYAPNTYPIADSAK